MARPKKKVELKTPVELEISEAFGAEELIMPQEPEILAEPTPQESINPDKLLYIATKFNLYHPFQYRHVDTTTPVELYMDGWLESQMNVGLVKLWQ